MLFTWTKSCIPGGACYHRRVSIKEFLRVFPSGIRQFDFVVSIYLNEEYHNTLNQSVQRESISRALRTYHDCFYLRFARNLPHLDNIVTSTLLRCKIACFVWQRNPLIQFKRLSYAHSFVLRQPPRSFLAFCRTDIHYHARGALILCFVQNESSYCILFRFLAHVLFPIFSCHFSCHPAIAMSLSPREQRELDSAFIRTIYP